MDQKETFEKIDDIIDSMIEHNAKRGVSITRLEAFQVMWKVKKKMENGEIIFP